MEAKRGGRAVIVGGSTSGLSCAHALIAAGWGVTVIEKSTSPPSGSPTGAGLGLDTQSRDLLARWVGGPDVVRGSTFPLSIDLNRATDNEKKISLTLARDDNFNFRAAHWTDLYSILYNALPSEIILWGHQFLLFQISRDKSTVTIKARVAKTGEIVEIIGDLLVAADGCLSSIRRNFLPDFKLRYAGYSAWRGVLNFSGKESSETITGIRQAYPELGDCLYFDLAHKTHCVLYELKDKRLNWIWYINGPEPELKHQVVDNEKKISRTLIRDDNFTYRCAHWTDLHSIIHKALPSGIILWGHRFLSLCISDDKAYVKIKIEVLQTNETKDMVADLLIAADGSLSMIRQHFLPDHKMRYSGYSAWRGVFDYSEDESSKTIVRIKKAYPELGSCLYFDYMKGNHCVLFELRNKRLNWIWYFITPEPDREGSSVTKKVNDDMIDNMHKEARKLWNPELALLMKETKEPFINMIYDSDPLPQLFWDNVVLVGDAAHPTTPHASRSTNMSVLDAEVLGLCLTKWGQENVSMALQEFQTIRLPVVYEQVLHSRLLGRLKQGLPLDNKIFDPSTADPEECGGIQHKNIPFYEHVPTSR